MAMRIEVVSDVVCPWCYISKRQLEKALAEFDGDVEGAQPAPVMRQLLERSVAGAAG